MTNRKFAVGRYVKNLLLDMLGCFLFGGPYGLMCYAMGLAFGSGSPQPPRSLTILFILPSVIGYMILSRGRKESLWK